jgi:hypothetical protein
LTTAFSQYGKNIPKFSNVLMDSGSTAGVKDGYSEKLPERTINSA